MSTDILDAGPYMAQERAVRQIGRLHAIMRVWHDSEHKGAYLRCPEQPCRDLNRQQQA